MNTVTIDALEALLRADRSVRRFDASRRIHSNVLRRLVALTRYCASGRNLQPLKYLPVTDPSRCDAMFPLLGWAGYYAAWAGPSAAERPTAYLVQCLDESLTGNAMCDDGLHLQTISLGATALGLGCCIIKSFDAQKLSALLGLPDTMRPLYVLAVGYPAEKVKIVDMDESGDYKYFRDADDCQCVPKRSADELLINPR